MNIWSSTSTASHHPVNTDDCGKLLDLVKMWITIYKTSLSFKILKCTPKLNTIIRTTKNTNVVQKMIIKTTKVLKGFVTDSHILTYENEVVLQMFFANKLLWWNEWNNMRKLSEKHEQHTAESNRSLFSSAVDFTGLSINPPWWILKPRSRRVGNKKKCASRLGKTRNGNTNENGLKLSYLFC